MSHPVSPVSANESLKDSMRYLSSPKIESLESIRMAMPGSLDNDNDDDMMSIASGFTNKDAQVEDKEVLARRETKAVNGLRVAVMFVLAVVAFAVSVSAFIFVRENETNSFQTAFTDQAARVVDAFQINAQRRVAAIQSFALSITSHARYSNSTWPFVTLPDFERRGVATSELAQVMSIIMAPFVTDETREEWEKYSVKEQGWFGEGLAVSNAAKEQSNSRNLQEEYSVPDEIYAVDGLFAGRERGPGPYLPQWQIAPIVPVPALVNFNLLSHEGYKDSLNAVLEAQVAIVGRSFDFSDPNDEAVAGRRDVFNFFLQNWKEDNVFENDPIADLHVPLYDDFDADDRTLVGLLTCVVYWRTYFLNILPDNTDGVVVVLENTCGQQYSYQINGPTVEYLGPGDKHDRQYDSFEESTPEGAYLQTDDEKRRVDGSCLYSIRVYPSEDFEDAFITNRPVIYTCVLVFVFLFTSMVFIAYDCLVERRQRVVMDTAVASSAIVSSLFPKVVRERLYNDERSESGMEKKDKRNRSIFMSEAGSQDGTGDVGKTKPIADLFQNCTVLFADIVGFTSWSSGREPTDVFVLLETLYGAFDKIAKRRRVFKVETIGDCYLAVTGLPDPQEEHAVIMCMFAQECLRKMHLIMEEELVEVLGEKSTSLSMRFGLHSGPVTAGVLRGEKSRFQLFGDTVNTAARMESTGIRDKIQLSQATADLLIRSNKGNWIEERQDVVQAKGKGFLQTYWLRLKRTMHHRPSQSPDEIMIDLAPEDGNRSGIRTKRKSASIDSTGSVSIHMDDSIGMPRDLFDSSGSLDKEDFMEDGDSNRSETDGQGKKASKGGGRTCGSTKSTEPSDSESHPIDDSAVRNGTSSGEGVEVIDHDMSTTLNV